MTHLKSLAIIGCQGMVGSDLMRYLKSYYQKVIGIDRNNYDQFRGYNFDIVINANGNSKKFWANGHALADFTASTTSVYKALFDFPCDTYVYISSSDVYENHTSKKTTNESIIINPENLSPYGLHKYLSECVVKNVVINYVILRSSMILGTNLKKGPVYDILHNSRLFITSKSRFQIITVAELARIIHILLSKKITREVFNVGGRGSVSLGSINKFFRHSIIFPKDGETQLYETSVSKLSKIFRLKTSTEYFQEYIKKISS